MEDIHNTLDNKRAKEVSLCVIIDFILKLKFLHVGENYSKFSDLTKKLLLTFLLRFLHKLPNIGIKVDLVAIFNAVLLFFH